VRRDGTAERQPPRAFPPCFFPSAPHDLSRHYDATQHVAFTLRSFVCFSVIRRLFVPFDCLSCCGRGLCPLTFGFNCSLVQHRDFDLLACAFSASAWLTCAFSAFSWLTCAFSAVLSFCSVGSDRYPSFACCSVSRTFL
jgi:hypothetical protein